MNDVQNIIFTTELDREHLVRKIPDKGHPVCIKEEGGRSTVTMEFDYFLTTPALDVRLRSFVTSIYPLAS